MERKTDRPGTAGGEQKGCYPPTGPSQLSLAPAALDASRYDPLKNFWSTYPNGFRVGELQRAAWKLLGCHTVAAAACLIDVKTAPHSPFSCGDAPWPRLPKALNRVLRAACWRRCQIKPCSAITSVSPRPPCIHHHSSPLLSPQQHHAASCCARSDAYRYRRSVSR